QLQLPARFPYTTPFRSSAAAGSTAIAATEPRTDATKSFWTATLQTGIGDSSRSSRSRVTASSEMSGVAAPCSAVRTSVIASTPRSEEHTSELQSPDHLV